MFIASSDFKPWPGTAGLLLQYAHHTLSTGHQEPDRQPVAYISYIAEGRLANLHT